MYWLLKLLKRFRRYCLSHAISRTIIGPCPRTAWFRGMLPKDVCAGCTRSTAFGGQGYHTLRVASTAAEAARMQIWCTMSSPEITEIVTGTLVTAWMMVVAPSVISECVRPSHEG